MSIKNDFPILASGACIYLDSASTTQKPAHVIRRVAEYLETGYANIHRGAYSLSEISEELYRASKIAVAKRIGAESPHEVVYTANATASYNLLAQSLAYSGLISRGDRVVLSLLEHHANIVPWLMLKNTL
jgi:cysteine desulfurase / selenocysteine lyase